MWPSNYWAARYKAPHYWPDHVVAVTTTAPRVLMRGIVQRAEITSGLIASLSAVDQLFADSGPFGPDQQWPPLIPASLFATAPPASVSRPFPVCYGEKSDEGATDPITGVARSKGLVPLLYIGQQNISDLTGMASPVPPLLVVDESIPAPTIGSMNKAGTASAPAEDGWDGRTYAYAAAVVGGVTGSLTPQATVGGDPGVLSATAVSLNRLNESLYVVDYYIAWVSDDPAFHPITNPFAGNVGVATHAGSGPDNYWYASLNSDADITIRVGITRRASAADLWDAYLVCLGASFRIISLFGSDLGKGVPENTPDRMQLVLAEHSGSSFLVPWDVDGNVDPNWPLPDTFVDYTDPETGTVYRCTMIFARGPISDDHKNGVVTMAVNMIGREHVGNGRGYPLIDAHAIEQHLFQNEFLAHKTSGPWVTDATAPKWADGTPVVRSSTFRDRQAFTVNALGNRGLIFGFYTDEAKTTLEWVRALMASTDTRTGTNGHGQIVKYGLDPDVDTSTWPRIDHVSDLFGTIRRVSGDERENVVLGQCDWDPDAERFRAKAGPTANTAAIAKNKGRKRQGDSIDSLFLNVATQLEWVLARRLERLAYGSTYVEITGGIGFLDQDVGDGIRLTSDEGPGADGYVDHPFVIVRRRLNFASLLVTYTLWDIADLLT